MIDWTNPTPLRAPKRERMLRESGDRERLARAKPCKGQKKHSVNRERSREESARAARKRDNAKETKASRNLFLEAARAYWRGESEGYPLSKE